MVTVLFDSSFERTIKKIKNNKIKERLKKQIKKIVFSPGIGKPMRYTRKNTREFYVSPYRLSYIYIKKDNKLIFLDIYHKDKQ